MSIGTDLGVGASIVAIAGAAYGATRWGTALYRRTLGSRSDLKERLNRLGCGVTLEYVEDLLGPPVFQRSIGSQDKFQCFERIYFTRHAWVLVWYTEHIRVIAITVTDRRFAFKTDWLTFDRIQVALGRSRFSDLPQGCNGRRLRSAEHTKEYAESYSFCESGRCQKYILSYNDAGYGQFDEELSDRGGMTEWSEGDMSERSRDENHSVAEIPSNLTQFRASTVVNTLTIYGLEEDEITTITCACTGVSDVVRSLHIKR
jgi:hypothetical protein